MQPASEPVAVEPAPVIEHNGHNHEHDPRFKTTLEKRRAAYIRAIRRKAARHVTPEESQRYAEEANRVVTENRIFL